MHYTTKGRRSKQPSNQKQNNHVKIFARLRNLLRVYVFRGGFVPGTPLRYYFRSTKLFYKLLYATPTLWVRKRRNGTD